MRLGLVDLLVLEVLESREQHRLDSLYVLEVDHRDLAVEEVSDLLLPV